MAERMSDKYELYLFHLFLGIAYEETSDLVKFGIPPTSAGHVSPIGQDLREKILPLFLEMDGVVKEACIKMIEESVSATDNGDDAVPWIKTIVHALKMRSSLLMKACGNEMEKVRKLLDEIDGILDKGQREDK
jgi:hypothetical protein